MLHAAFNGVAAHSKPTGISEPRSEPDSSMKMSVLIEESKVHILERMEL
jgi:hypothetical protein